MQRRESPELNHQGLIKGRGSLDNPAGRFEKLADASVGAFYENFSQTSDEEVMTLLKVARSFGQFHKASA